MRTFILTTIAIISTIQIHAARQTSAINNELFSAQTVHLDEFFARFNGTEVPEHLNQIADETERRKVALCQLFDLADIAGPNDPKAAPILEMADAIIDSKAQLGFNSHGWYARAVCMAKIAGKPSEIILYLRTYQIDDEVTIWTISDAVGDALSLALPDNSGIVFLDPSGHETNFMELRRITSDTPRFITRYITPGTKISTLDVFATLVYFGQLKIDAVSKLEFVFENVAGYTFTVGEFKRETSNSGWLISSFNKIDNE